jgi:uncharacterized repeat protein (TIGR03803 family)
MLRTRYSASSFRLLCPCYDPNDRLLRFILIGLTAVFLVQYSQAQTESVLYNFKGGTTDGSSPYAGLLLDQHGNLFGTTGKGGIYSNSGHGGIAFELSPAGPRYAEKILYNFGGVIDGYQPLSGLVEDSSGNLYGTAYYGGGAGCGTFYKITPGISWTETGLFDFPCSWPGQWPVDAGKLAVDSSGNFYGTTFEGGYSGQGMVFKMTVTLDGITDQLIYSFDRTQDYLDGTYPDASVIMDAEGNLYGTTHGGGVAGWGTVFELSPNDNGTWNETIIHSFLNSPSDGAAPYANLVMDQYGNLFGTTTGGGLYGYGAVYELLPNGHGVWTELVIHSFGHSTDGATPYSGLIVDSNRNLYGTTTGGGTSDAGTVYELSPFGGLFWKESVLYSFKGGATDGATPYGGLVRDGSGNLFGTTLTGGTTNKGTVFKLVP